jgi:hypothetical protein
MGDLSIGKMHKDSLEFLVGMSIDKNDARQVHGRAFEKMN